MKYILPICYTGAYTGDYNELVYLRSRMYDPSSGRFTTKDSWQGDYNRPLSLNKWNYVEANPINRTDPSGKCWYPNLQTGGTSIDLSVPSSGVCPWFVNAFQQNGISIPTNATPDNWLDSIPLEQRLLISSFVSCEFGGDTFLTQGHDYWMVIRYSTSSKWKYFESTSTGVEFKLILGLGGGGSLSCDNSTGNCTVSGQLELGEGASLGNFKLALGFGVGGEYTYKGSFLLGGYVDAGPCNLFITSTKISAQCLAPGTGQVSELGWWRYGYKEYWVLVNWFTVGRIGFTDFGEQFVVPPEYAKETINYWVRDTNINKHALKSRYSNYQLIEFP